MNRYDLEAQEIEKIKGQINQVKNTIKDINARKRALSSQPVFRHGEGLGHAMGAFLPPGMAPKNVGNINTVSWQFYYTMDFDLSTTSIWQTQVGLTGNGAISDLTRQVSSFQVSQEAAFLMMGVMRHANDYSDAGDLGPLAIEFRDAQSSRFFNNEPTPIQNFAQKGYISYMATPMILMPNARYEGIMTTTLDTGVTQQVDPSDTGKHSFTFFGYRIRVEDADKVLSSIFG